MMSLAVSSLLAFLAAFRVTPSVQPLEHHLKGIRDRAGGRIGISVVHLESRATATVDASQALPLYSVFKLPLAIVVLKDVEAGRLRLDQRVRVNPSEVSPGSPGNTERWKAAPVTPDLQQLLEYSLVDSDNTSSDKLLELVGGPRSLVKRLRGARPRGDRHPGVESRVR